MHILYFHQYFNTRQSTGGTRSYEFARRLIIAKHDVTIVTSGAQQNLSSVDEVDGIKVIRLKAGFIGNFQKTKIGYKARILEFLKFAILSCFVVGKISKPDIVFATSTPLTIGIPGFWASFWYRVPLVFEVRDLWPEAPIQIGAIKNPVIISLGKWFERHIYKYSSHIIALSPGIRNSIINAGMPPDKVTMLPNSSDLDLFSPSIDGTAIRKKLSLENKFVCTYFGAMGEANDLTFVAKAAKILNDQRERNILFVLHGDGKRRVWLEKYRRKYSLPNILFSDPVSDKTYVAQLAAASDLLMTIYKDLPVLYTCSPNKFFDSLAAGKPVLINTPGWLKELVELNKVGLAVKPGNAEDIAEKVKFLSKRPDLCREYGKNARKLAERQFSRDILAKKLEIVFLNVAKEI